MTIHRRACRTFPVRLGLPALLLALGAAATAQPTPPAGTATPGQAFQLALEAQSARDYPGMLAWLRQAARSGDLQAQEMLGLVLLHAPVLYGDAVRPDRCEALVWMRLAAARGSEVAQYQVHLLNRVRPPPGSRSHC